MTKDKIIECVEAQEYFQLLDALTLSLLLLSNYARGAGHYVRAANLMESYIHFSTFRNELDPNDKYTTTTPAGLAGL